MIRFIKKIFDDLLYENNKLSAGRLMMWFTFFVLNAFWISNIWIPMNVPSSLENVFYALLAYVFGTKGVNVAKTAVNKQPITPTIVTQKTINIDSPD